MVHFLSVLLDKSLQIRMYQREKAREEGEAPCEAPTQETLNTVKVLVFLCAFFSRKEIMCLFWNFRHMQL